jgi:hypothetical protein
LPGRPTTGSACRSARASGSSRDGDGSGGPATSSS